jgi:glycosyltransferase involved in cell wall biosynthesis
LAYLAEACRILPWLKSYGATHVHAHFAGNSTDVALLLRVLGGPPFSFTVHGTAEFDVLQFLGMEEKVQRAAFVVSASSYGRSQIFRRIPYANWPKVNVIHCGLETAFYTVEPTSPAAKPRLVCVGRLSPEKGQLLLVEAMHRLAEKGLNFDLVLAGDGAIRGDIEALVAKYELRGHVRITGWLGNRQVREEILAAWGLVLPSFSEGLPVVIMEAMALRRPVLATSVGGIPELVRQNVDGILFPAGSVEALMSALEDFLSRPQGELQTMGEAARMRAVERHAIDTEAAKLAALFRNSPERSGSA